MESCPHKRNKGIQIQNGSQPGNRTTPATSESANLHEVDEEQASPGIPGLRPSEPSSAERKGEIFMGHRAGGRSG